MKKVVVLVLIAVLMFSFAACSQTEENKPSNTDAKSTEKVVITDKPSEPKEPTIVKVWRHSGKPEEQENIQAQIARFNESNDLVQIDYEVIPEGEYNTQVSAASMSDGLPDVFMLDGPNMSNYAWAGFLLPLDNYVTDDMKNDLLPSILAQSTYKGQMYAIGSFDSGLALWGNKSYLEAAGVRIPTSAKEAWTLDEFNDALEKLKALEQVEYPLDLKLNYGQGEWYTYGFSPVVQSFGGDLINRETMVAEGTINGEKSVEALKWFQGLADKGYVNVTQVSDDDFYGPEKISALAFVGHWMTMPHKEGLGDDLVLIPLPKFGDRVVTGMGSWAWAISSTTENPDAAWEVMSYFISTENVTTTAVATGAVPARKSVLESVAEYQEDGMLYIFREQLEGGYALERPTTPAYPVITTQFAEAFQNIIKGSDVKEQLDKAAKTIDDDIKENNDYK